jgi:ADP-ribosylglycohydrolase
MKQSRGQRTNGIIKRDPAMKTTGRRTFIKTGIFSMSGLLLPGTLTGLTLPGCSSGIRDREAFLERVLGCFMGAAIGDSLGGAVECQHYRRIRKYVGDFTDLLPYGKPVSVWDPPSEGWAQREEPGTITDDTYIRMDLLEFFLHVKPPYTAGKLADYLLENSDFFGWWDPPLNHLRRVGKGEFSAANAGQFMEIQGGGGGWWQPVSIMHAGNPEKASTVASALCSIWKTGLARDILSSVVAGQAAAFRPGASIDSIIDAVITDSGPLAKKLFERAVHIARESVSAENLYENLYQHASVSNATHTGEYNRVEGPLPPAEKVEYTEDTCSSIAFAEQQPWALAYLVYGNGDPEKTLLTAVKGGRDADSIATNTASWLGAMHGLSIWPARWIQQVQEANLVDFDLLKAGRLLADTALKRGSVEMQL